jgi:hypothetical protein
MDEAFPDNWTYLRTELNWLDRLLASAIARQRKDTKEIERVSKARIDQITSHWWKGLIQVDGAIASDSPAEMPRRHTSSMVNYQQRLEVRVQASQQRGIVLGLPALCQRLNLSTFEKNLLLFALAPEISRRYGRIYNFLQDTDHPGASGLPTIDLILRLLCRNDDEWRSARLSLTSQAKLLQHEIVVLPQLATESFLSHPVKLAATIAEYLLADSPQIITLDTLLQLPTQPDRLAVASSMVLPAACTLAPVTLSNSLQSPLSTIEQLPPPAEDLWPKLVLPKKLVLTLQHFCDRLRYANAGNEQWPWPHDQAELKAGTIALLVGEAGTGKTLVARAIAQALDVSLAVVDLARINLSQSNQVLQQITENAPTILLLKAASYWFGRSAPVESFQLRQFLHQRQYSQTITLLSTDPTHPIKPSWYNYLISLNVPFPTQADRLTLWQQAFPPEVPLAADLDWQKLTQFRLSGGQIQAIARAAIVLAIASAAKASQQAAEKPNSGVVKPLGMSHILQAYQFKY